MQYLDIVFNRLKEHNLKLKPSECHLFRSKVSYLGHVLSADGISTDDSKIKVVREWPVPRSVKQLRAFLGFASYYRRYVLLHSLIGECKGKSARYFQGRWTDKCQSAFDLLKEKFVSTPVLGYADFNKPFIVEVDASLDGLGAVLSQDQDGKRHVIAYASRTLRPYE